MTWHKKSYVWKINESVFREAIAASGHYHGTMLRLQELYPDKKIGRIPVRRRAEALSLDMKHFLTGYAVAAISRQVPDERMFCADSNHVGSSLRPRFKKKTEGQYFCTLCGLQPEWQGKPLVLIMDHINGVSNDNRLENLRWLCPNCNAQQPTFCCSRYQREMKERGKNKPRGPNGEYIEGDPPRLKQAREKALGLIPTSHP